MLSQMKCCFSSLLVSAVLATLVFASPRTGKNCFDKGFAGLKMEHVVVQDVAAPIGRAQCELTGSSSNDGGNVSVEVLKGIDEGNAMLYSNMSTNAEQLNWTDMKLQTPMMFEDRCALCAYGFDTERTSHTDSINRSWLCRFKSYFASRNFSPGGIAFELEPRVIVNKLGRNPHMWFTQLSDEYAYGGANWNWNSTRSFRRRRSDYASPQTIYKLTAVSLERLRYASREWGSAGGSAIIMLNSSHVVRQPICGSFVAIDISERFQEGCGAGGNFSRQNDTPPLPIPPFPEVVALNALWYVMKEYVSKKDARTFMSVWNCKSSIPQHAWWSVFERGLFMSMYCIYELTMYMLRVTFVIAVGTITTLWMSLCAMSQSLKSLAAVLAVIVSQRPKWADAVIEADIFSVSTMERLRLDLFASIRLFLKVMGQFVFSRALRHVAKSFLFPTTDVFDVVPASFALAGIAALLRTVLIDMIVKERRSKVKRFFERKFQPFATMFFWLIILLSMTATGATPPCQTCFSATCAGGNKCPLLETTLTNTSIMMGAVTTGVITCLDLLPLKFILVLTNATLNSLMAVAKRGVVGEQVDLTALDVPEFIQRITTGAVSVADGLAEVLRRQAAVGIKATELNQLTSIQSTLLAMNTQGWGIAQASASETRTRVFGAYSFVMGLAARIALNESGRSATAGVVDSNVATERMGVVTSTLVRPKTSLQLSEFLLNWIMIVHATGLANALVAGAFVREVVYEGMSITGLSWQVAHELFLVYLFEVERGITRGVSLCNVFAQGSQDTNVRTATRNALLEYGEGSDKQVVTAVVVKEKIRTDTVTWNGRSTPNAQKCCKVYNGAPGATHAKADLGPDGKCKHKHGCDKWVTNNGKFGRCESTSHTRQNCNNTNACDDPVST